MGGQNLRNNQQNTASLDDIFSSPLIGLSAGLLEAARPSRGRPGSLAGGLSRGLSLASQMSGKGLDSDLRKAQIDKLREEQKVREQERERARSFQKIISRAAPAGQTGAQAPVDGDITTAIDPTGNQPIQGQIASDMAENDNLKRPQQQGVSDSTVLKEGNKNLYHLDRLYEQYPQYRDYFNKQGLKTSQQIKQSPETGQTFIETTYPSGKVEVRTVQVGRSPEQRKRSEKFAEADADTYKKAMDSYETAQGALDNLDYISDLVKTRPEFQNVVGPVNSVLTNWTGGAEDRRLLGNVNSAVGNIVLDAAKSIKGAFTGRDISLINSIKPNVNDRVDVFKGKLEAMSVLANAVSERNKKIMGYIREDGLSPEKAISKARKETDLKKYTDEINSILNPKKQTQIKVPEFKTRREFLSYLSRLTPQQRQQVQQQVIGG